MKLTFTDSDYSPLRCGHCGVRMGTLTPGGVTLLQRGNHTTTIQYGTEFVQTCGHCSKLNQRRVAPPLTLRVD